MAKVKILTSKRKTTVSRTKIRNAVKMLRAAQEDRKVSPSKAKKGNSTPLAAKK